MAATTPRTSRKRCAVSVSQISDLKFDTEPPSFEFSYLRFEMPSEREEEMSLEELNRKLKEQHLIGYWTIPNTSTGFLEPEANFRPYLWKWNEIRAALDQAAEFIRPEEAFRRFIG